MDDDEWMTCLASPLSDNEVISGSSAVDRRSDVPRVAELAAGDVSEDDDAWLACQAPPAADDESGGAPSAAEVAVQSLMADSSLRFHVSARPKGRPRKQALASHVGGGASSLSHNQIVVASEQSASAKPYIHLELPTLPLEISRGAGFD